ncbi:MAG: hypothetical protein OCD02_18345 [Spirochaetaceae bacterium]
MIRVMPSNMIPGNIKQRDFPAPVGSKTICLGMVSSLSSSP